MLQFGGEVCAAPFEVFGYRHLSRVDRWRLLRIVAPWNRCCLMSTDAFRLSCGPATTDGGSQKP